MLPKDKIEELRCFVERAKDYVANGPLHNGHTWAKMYAHDVETLLNALEENSKTPKETCANNAGASFFIIS